MKFTMRRLRLELPLAIGLLCGLPLAVSAQRTVNEVRPAAPDGAVRINNPAGRVRVTGWERDSIAVTGTVAAGGVPFQLHVSGASAKLGLWSEEAQAPAAVLEVRVPARSRVWVRTATADVTIGDLRGSVDVSTVAGRIDVRGQPADLYLESMGGPIDVEVDSKVLRARTAGSDITIRGRIADAEAYTVTGVISILNKQVERGRFESVDGGVRYRGGFAPTSTVEFVTHGGDIDVTLPGSLAADISISSFQGKVSSELGKLVRRTAAAQSASYALSLGGGGAEINIRTFKGAVRLHRM